MKTKKEFRWRGKCYRWEMKAWIATLIVTGQVMLLAGAFVVTALLLAVITQVTT